MAGKLPNIYTNIGTDYDERVLPSIVNEVLKAVVVSIINIYRKNISCVLCTCNGPKLQNLTILD